MIINVWVKKKFVIFGIEVGIGIGVIIFSFVGVTIVVGTILGIFFIAGGIIIFSVVVVIMFVELSCGIIIDTGGIGIGVIIFGGGIGELDRDGLFLRFMGLVIFGGVCNVLFIIRIYVIYIFII